MIMANLLSTNVARISVDLDTNRADYTYSTLLMHTTSYIHTTNKRVPDVPFSHSQLHCKTKCVTLTRMYRVACVLNRGG